jgi:glycerol-3-phosphate O-acyltransferase/dihydroxyacetone phosphate acyltransferase
VTAVVELVHALVRLYYPRIEVEGASDDPVGDGPCMVVANHPNGLLDPVVLRVALDRPLGFLAKHTLFENPVLLPFLEAFRAIPVYRAKDGDTSRNLETFARARALLAEGGWVAMFPEGISHDSPVLQPLRTGAARILLGADPRVRVLPVGLTYEAAGTFRSGVTVAVGSPVDVARWRGRGESPDAVDGLTAEIEGALRAQVLEADDRSLWHGFRAVARWLGEPGEGTAATDARARTLSHAWRRADPHLREVLAEDARLFASRLAELGVADPLALDAGLPDVSRVGRAVLPLALLTPPALVGALLGGPAYLAVDAVAGALAESADVLSTWKVLVGLVLYPTWWALQVGVVAVTLGAGWAVALAVLAPTCGLAALLFQEKLARRRALGRAWWALLTQDGVVATLREERLALARRVRAALDAT